MTMFQWSKKLNLMGLKSTANEGFNEVKMDINVKHFSEFLANYVVMPAVCIPPNSEGKTKQEQWEMFITAWNKLDKKNEFDDSQ